MSLKINQLNRERKRARTERAATRLAANDYLRGFQEDARSVIPRRILLNDTLVVTHVDLPTDSDTRDVKLAPPVRRTRIVRGVASIAEACATQKT